MNLEKFEAQKQWNANPCGTGSFLDDIEYGSLEFFETIRKNRYEVTDRWMNSIIPFETGKGMKVLEIGYGIGTDLLRFCEAGAEVYGIDITEEHYRLAQKNFVLHGRECNLKLCDANNIEFPADYFDIVYSHGVLHHTPDTVRCISEAYRVLKPGGTFILSLYYKYSAFHLFFMLLYNGLLKGQLKKLGYRGLMATVEMGADGIKIKPLVKTFSRSQLKYILADFKKIDIKIAHFQRQHIPVLWHIMPAFIEPILEPVLGWYIISIAVK